MEGSKPKITPEARISLSVVALRIAELSGAISNLEDPEKLEAKVAVNRALLPESMSDEAVRDGASGHLKEQVRLASLVLGGAVRIAHKELSPGEPSGNAEAGI